VEKRKEVAPASWALLVFRPFRALSWQFIHENQAKSEEQLPAIVFGARALNAHEHNVFAGRIYTPGFHQSDTSVLLLSEQRMPFSKGQETYL
jgi:hypothetical protein